MNDIMRFEDFKKVFDGTIFEKSKADLLEKIAKYPDRYIGLFRPTRPKAKILQNLLQSHEIRFGDAFEAVIEEYLKLLGYELLPKRHRNSKDEVLNLDQFFRANGKVYFIEQKVRDDHDSTKKRGQIRNFEDKLVALTGQYAENELEGIFYFIDPALKKNRNYYGPELEKMKADYGVSTHIFYGQEMFTHLGLDHVWTEILDYLKRWKEEIPDLPEINFDIDAEETFAEIKDLSPTVYRELILKDLVFNPLMKILFPTGRTLQLLEAEFAKNPKPIYPKHFPKSWPRGVLNTELFPSPYSSGWRRHSGHGTSTLNQRRIFRGTCQTLRTWSITRS